MKKQYVNPSMEVVAFQQQGYILTDSLKSVDSNVGIEFIGGGSVEPMSREVDFGDDFF